MIRAVLLLPPLSGERSSYKESVFYMPHIGVAYLASYLLSKNIEVKVIDAQVDDINIRQTLDIIEKFDPNYVCITAPTSQIFEAHEVAKHIKKRNSKMKVIIGGWHATSLPVETMKDFPYFDFLVRGEGEITLHELIDTIENNKSLSKVNGIAYREDNKIKLTKPRSFNENLDDLPFPAWELFNLKKYNSLFKLKKGTVELPICTSRGCPYQCVFCSRVSGEKVRCRSIENVVEEIENNINHFGAKSFVFTDETFTIFRDRAVKFCEEIKKRGIHKKVTWICETRADKVDLSLLKLLKESGCVNILYGVESGNQEILNKIKKNITVKQIKDAVKWTKEAGINAYESFIIGLPYETRETIKDTVDLAIKTDPDFVSFNILVPFPGTEIIEMSKNQKSGISILTNDWRKYGKQIGKSFELKNINRNELEKLQRNAYMRFYLRPSKILNLFRVVRRTSSLVTYALNQLFRN